MPEILKPNPSGGLSTARAAEWAVQINSGTAAAPEWVWINGISKFDPSQDPTLQDDTDINSQGYKSQLVTAQALNVSAEGLIKGERSDAVFAVDPGCNLLREKGRKIGEDNIVHLRFWRTDDLPDSFEHHFAASYKDVGGGNEDLQKWTCDLQGRGKPVEVDKPEPEEDENP